MIYFKRVGSLVLLAVGIYLVIYGINTLHPIEIPQSTWEKTSDFFVYKVWDPVVKFFGGTPTPPKEVPPIIHKASLIYIIIGGLLTLAGAFFSYLFFQRSRRF